MYPPLVQHPVQKTAAHQLLVITTTKSTTICPLTGYFSTTARIPDALTDQQLALRKIKNPETLDIIGKLVKNVATQPNEDKYRTIRTSNPKINAAIIEQEGGLSALLSLGFAPTAEDANVLEVPKGVLTMKEVRLVEDTKDWLKKELRAMSRSSSKSSLKENDTDPAKAALRAQLEVLQCDGCFGCGYGKALRW